VDRSFNLVPDKRAIGTDLGGIPAVKGIKLFARAQHATFNQLAKRHARLGAFRGGGLQRFLIELAYGFDPLFGNLAIRFFPFDPNKVAAQHLGNCTCGACAKERIKHDITGVGRPHKDTVQQAFGLLRRMRFIAHLVLQTFVAGADRQHPITAHLDTFVQRFQRFVVEGVFGILVLAGPDHGFMRIGKALAAKVRHRVRLAPHHVVQDPETRILQCGTNAENIVIAANNPDRAIGFQQTPRGFQPFAGKLVIDGKAGKLVPRIIDRIHL